MEENPKNPGSGGNYQSAEELIQAMKLAFANAAEPEILAELQTVGITAQKLADYNAQITQIESLSQQQIKEYGEQYEESEKFETKRKEVDAVYRRHFGLLKIAMKGDRQADASLGFSAGRKNAYPAWYEQVNNFYAQIAANPAFLAKAASVGISAADITAQQTALEDLSEIKTNHKKETGEAQKATETRDNAIDELYPAYKDLIDYAKILLKNDQSLEKLGIVVKRK